MNASIYFVNYYAVKNFYELLNGKPLFRTRKSLVDRSPEINKLMGMMFRTYAIHQAINNFESFYVNMPSQEYVDFFVGERMSETYKKTLKDEMNALAMSALDIVEGFDQKDGELLSILG